MSPRKRVSYRGRVIVIPVKPALKMCLRVGLTLGFVAIVVYVAHGLRGVTAVAVGIRFVEVLGDVVADRLLPHMEEEL